MRTLPYATTAEICELLPFLKRIWQNRDFDTRPIWALLKGAGALTSAYFDFFLNSGLQICIINVYQSCLSVKATMLKCILELFAAIILITLRYN